jgi:hypothetical protein
MHFHNEVEERDLGPPLTPPFYTGHSNLDLMMAPVAETCRLYN